MKTTPGPWKVVDLRYQKNGQIRLFSESLGHHRLIANILATGENPAGDANLIAAAPDLLEALELAARIIEGEDLDGKYNEYCIIQDAIRKARGE